jgi:hypothetical protein
VATSPPEEDIMRSLLPALSLFVLVPALSACDPIEGFCQKQYDCQEELGRNLEDDFPAVCAAAARSGLDALRANTEPECGELAAAQEALMLCENLLSCEDLKKLESGDGTICADQKKALVEANKAALDDDGSFKCDAIEPAVAAEGEGEGEGEGE